MSVVDYSFECHYLTFDFLKFLNQVIKGQTEEGQMTGIFDRFFDLKLFLKRSLKLCDSVTVVIHANRHNWITFPIFGAIQAVFLNASFNDMNSLFSIGSATC